MSDGRSFTIKDKFIRFLTLLRDRANDAEINTSSVAVAYYVLLSLFPMLITIGNLLPLFNIDPNSVLPYLDGLIPEPVLEIISPIIVNLLTTSSGGLLSIGIIGTLWSASRGISYIDRGINKAYGLHGTRGYLLSKIISVLTLIAIIIVLVSSTFIFSLGETVLDFITDLFGWHKNTGAYISALRLPVSAFILFSIFTAVYIVTPNAKIRLRHALPGSLLVTAGWLLLSNAFAVYLNFASRSISTYGTLGAFIVLILWLNFLGYLIILGAVLNAALYEYWHGKPMERNGINVAFRERFRKKLSVSEDDGDVQGVPGDAGGPGKDDAEK